MRSGAWDGLELEDGTMSEASKDTQRALAAVRSIVDGRDRSDASSIMVTLEHAIATVLIAIFPDTRMAAAMLNEGLLQGVEARLARYRSKERAR